MRELQKGDVVVTMFPFADWRKAKIRPALVYAGPWKIGDFSIVWIMMITSSKRETWPHDVAIGNLDHAGLPGASLVRVLKIACIDTRNIARTVGMLDAKTLRAVRSHFEQID